MTYVHPRAYLLRRRYPALEWEDGVHQVVGRLGALRVAIADTHRMHPEPQDAADTGIVIVLGGQGGQTIVRREHELPTPEMIDRAMAEAAGELERLTAALRGPCGVQIGFAGDGGPLPASCALQAGHDGPHVRTGCGM